MLQKVYLVGTRGRYGSEFTYDVVVSTPERVRQFLAVISPDDDEPFLSNRVPAVEAAYVDAPVVLLPKGVSVYYVTLPVNDSTEIGPHDVVSYSTFPGIDWERPSPLRMDDDWILAVRARDEVEAVTIARQKLSLFLLDMAVLGVDLSESEVVYDVDIDAFQEDILGPGDRTTSR